MRYVLVFALAMIADVVAAVHIYALSQSVIWLAATSGFIIPFCNLMSEIWIIEEKSNLERAKITMAAALGVAAGTSMTLAALPWIFS